MGVSMSVLLLIVMVVVAATVVVTVTVTVVAVIVVWVVGAGDEVVDVQPTNNAAAETNTAGPLSFQSTTRGESVVPVS